MRPDPSTQDLLDDEDDADAGTDFVPSRPPLPRDDTPTRISASQDAVPVRVGSPKAQAPRGPLNPETERIEMPVVLLGQILDRLDTIVENTGRSAVADQRAVNGLSTVGWWARAVLVGVPVTFAGTLLVVGMFGVLAYLLGVV